MSTSATHALNEIKRVPSKGTAVLISPINKPVSEGIEKSKQLAAWTAVDQYIKPEYTTIGIGSGSTVPYVVERIVHQGAEANEHRVFIPTGFQSRELILQSGLQIGDIDQHPSLDITIDGADECDAQLNCIKGGGACHLREKVIAEAAKTFIVVADYRKNTDKLGTVYKPGVPIEVVPIAYGQVLRVLRDTFGVPEAKLRMAVAKAGPVVSDNGNFVIDAPFTPEQLSNPMEVLTKVKMLTGVVEVGLFCQMAQAAFFGNENGSVTMRAADGSTKEIAADTTVS